MFIIRWKGPIKLFVVILHGRSRYFGSTVRYCCQNACSISWWPQIRAYGMFRCQWGNYNDTPKGDTMCRNVCNLDATAAVDWKINELWITVTVQCIKYVEVIGSSIFRIKLLDFWLVEHFSGFREGNFC